MSAANNPRDSVFWLLADDDRHTVHGLAAHGRKRASDIRFVLSFEGVPVDWMDTVRVGDLRIAGLIPAGHDHHRKPKDPLRGSAAGTGGG